jgi:tetratricopeptide (TPR) repeat protein
LAVDNPRILELQRRVDADPESIAFAQLAEEHRRSGYYDEAVQCCRTGLARHPGYLSARVTLGRALIELGSLEEAEREFELVLESAPDNLAAIRGMAEIHQRRGNLALALEFYRRALPLARHDPELEEAITKIDRELATVRPASGPTGLSFLDELELFSAAPPPPSAPAAASPSPVESIASASPVAEDDLGSIQPPPAIATTAEQPPTELAEPEREAEPEPEREAEREAQAEPVAWTMPDTLDLDVDTASLFDSRDKSTADSDAPVDFNALLRSLGVPDATPPAIMEMLLAAPPAAEHAEPVLSHLPDLADEAPNDPFSSVDPFASLERELRALEFPRAEVSAPPARGGTEVPPSVRTTAVVILNELEAWLTAIQENRDDRPESV